MLCRTVHGLGFIEQVLSDGHFHGTPAGDDAGVENDVADDVHGVQQVALDLVEHVWFWIKI